MIPKPYIAKWQDYAPWSSFDFVEQDMIISRTLIDIFSDGFLNENLAFRGGTALHKLYLSPATRYSEDIDLVQVKKGPIKPILTKIDEVVDFFEEDRIVKQKSNNNTVLYRFESEYTGIRLRLKIEINCREHFNLFGWVEYPFEMTSEWYSGNTKIRTFDINELLGTKIRALYQRKKGRDLFDLYHADHHFDLDYDKIIRAYAKYIQFAVNSPPTQKQYLRNINLKEKDSYFLGDMEGLLRPGIEFDHKLAFEWVKKELVSRI